MDVKNLIQSTDSFPPTPKIDLMITVNGVQHQLHVAPAARLVDILREDLGLTGTKMSCEIGRCGACAVHLNNQLVNSCLVMAYQANHSSIYTIEGLAEKEYHPIQTAFLEEGGFQCGYCTPGMVMAVKALIDSNPNPTKEQIQEALSGNLCRCTGYSGIIRAVKKASSSLKEKEMNDTGRITMQKVNQMNKEEFVNIFGWIFEHSPWVVEKAWERLPFQSRKELFQAMTTVIQNAEEILQLALLRSHPDLGTKLKMSEVSQKEQAGVGLDKLSKGEYEELVSLNQRYVKKFGFPFIMAVKGQNKDSIISAMKERVNYCYEVECITAMNEVYKIAGFRLNDILDKGDE